MSLRTVFDETRKAIDDTEKLVHAKSVEGASALSIREIREMNEATLQLQLRKRFRLVISGSHGSISNQRLYEIHRDADRDFAANTVQLTQQRRKVLRQWLRGFTRLASVDELEERDGAVILAWIVERRLQRGNGDLLLPPLAASTLKQKRRTGGATTIGVNTGLWREAIRKGGRIEFY